MPYILFALTCSRIFIREYIFMKFYISNIPITSSVRSVAVFSCFVRTDKVSVAFQRPFLFGKLLVILITFCFTLFFIWLIFLSTPSLIWRRFSIKLFFPRMILDFSFFRDGFLFRLQYSKLVSSIVRLCVAIASIAW